MTKQNKQVLTRVAAEFHTPIVFKKNRINSYTAIIEGKPYGSKTRAERALEHRLLKSK